MRFLGRCLVCVATAAFGLLAAQTAVAQQQMAPPKVGWLAYRNDSPITLVVQASAPGPNNQERKGPPHQIGDLAAEERPGRGIGGQDPPRRGVQHEKTVRVRVEEQAEHLGLKV